MCIEVVVGRLETHGDIDLEDSLPDRIVFLDEA